MARDDWDLPEATIQNMRDRYGTFSWQGQALQYPQRNDPNTMDYRRYTGNAPQDQIDALLHYDAEGWLDGVLTYFPLGSSLGDSPHEFTLTLRPGAESVSRFLYAEAKRRWPHIREHDNQLLDNVIVGRGGIDGNRRTPRLPNL